MQNENTAFLIFLENLNNVFWEFNSSMPSTTNTNIYKVIYTEKLSNYENTMYFDCKYYMY